MASKHGLKDLFSPSSVYSEISRRRVRAARISEEIKKRDQDSAKRDRSYNATTQGRRTTLQEALWQQQK